MKPRRRQITESGNAKPFHPQTPLCYYQSMKVPKRCLKMCLLGFLSVFLLAAPSAGATSIYDDSMNPVSSVFVSHDSNAAGTESGTASSVEYTQKLLDGHVIVEEAPIQELEEQGDNGSSPHGSSNSGSKRPKEEDRPSIDHITPSHERPATEESSFNWLEGGSGKTGVSIGTILLMAAFVTLSIAGLVIAMKKRTKKAQRKYMIDRGNSKKSVKNKK